MLGKTITDFIGTPITLETTSNLSSQSQKLQFQECHLEAVPRSESNPTEPHVEDVSFTAEMNIFTAQLQTTAFISFNYLTSISFIQAPCSCTCLLKPAAGRAHLTSVSGASIQNQGRERAAEDQNRVNIDFALESNR
ncbi:Hypothetical predicted protein [Xyrichtys novacula]|uniref:Uncharacterized protein n=1 Tax=Xyrichtys novacula TaxID=13765 RepID=A0AAV1EQ47_XYRNO|nr:Hypothetical predicted protein [Xyrichtys novacula]